MQPSLESSPDKEQAADDSAGAVSLAQEQGMPIPSLSGRMKSWAEDALDEELGAAARAAVLGSSMASSLRPDLSMRLNMNCRPTQDDGTLSFSLSFVNHSGLRKKVGFLYNLEDDHPVQIANEMVENLSLKVEEAEFIAQMIQQQVSRFSNGENSNGPAAGEDGGDGEGGQAGGQQQQQGGMAEQQQQQHRQQPLQQQEQQQLAGAGSGSLVGQGSGAESVRSPMDHSRGHASTPATAPGSAAPSPAPSGTLQLPLTAAGSGPLLGAHATAAALGDAGRRASSAAGDPASGDGATAPHSHAHSRRPSDPSEATASGAPTPRQQSQQPAPPDDAPSEDYQEDDEDVPSCFF